MIRIYAVPFHFIQNDLSRMVISHATHQRRAVPHPCKRDRLVDSVSSHIQRNAFLTRPFPSNVKVTLTGVSVLARSVRE